MKKTNIYLYGFVKYFGHTIVDELRKDYNIVGWVGDSSDSTVNIWECLFGTIPPSLIDSNALERYEKYYDKYFLKYLLMVQRRGMYWKDVFEVRNEFSILYYNAYNSLQNGAIDMVVFSNLPHEGPDYIYYTLAKELDINTLLLHQSLFLQKIFVTTTIEDFGLFENTDSLFTNNIKVVEGFKNRLIKTKRGNEKKITVNKAYKIFISKVYNLLNYKKEKDLFKDIVLKVVSLLKNYKYKKNLSNNMYSMNQIKERINKDTKIIYVPLHYQPELTTVTHGDIYEDQLSMIEALSVNIGLDGVVLIKDNPIQGSFQRGEDFFRRLNALNNVYLVDIEYESFKLLEICDLVATISGTAGWEAIKGGKKCLLFGRAWYQSLPGCYVYDYSLDINELIKQPYDFNFKKIENQFSSLMDKCADGVIDSDYIDIDRSNFDYIQNAKTVTASLNKILNNKILN